ALGVSSKPRDCVHDVQRSALYSQGAAEDRPDRADSASRGSLRRRAPRKQRKKAWLELRAAPVSTPPHETTNAARAPGTRVEPGDPSDPRPPNDPRPPRDTSDARFPGVSPNAFAALSLIALFSARALAPALPGSTTGIARLISATAF